MKFRIFVYSAMMMAVLCGVSEVRSAEVVYESSFYTTETLNAVGPYNLAVDSNGGLYFATFDGPASDVYYIADPVGAHASVVKTGNAAFAAFPAGRGIQGLSVDASGNLYATGDTGTAGASVVAKLGPPPNFTADAGFAPNGTGRRWLGNTILSDGLVALFQFNSINIVNANTGAQLAGLYLDNTSNYQRDGVVNPATMDIFITRNGANAIGGLVQWSGGTPSTLGAYARTTISFLSNLADSSVYGNAGQGIGFFAPRSWLMVNNQTTDNEGIDVYSISGAGASATATFVQHIDGSESGTPIHSIADAVMVNYTDAERLFISDFDANRILVYSIPNPTRAAGHWMLLE